MVAFATKVQQDTSTPGAPEPQVALKFYVQPDLIRVETAVYGNPTLASFGALPRSAQLHLNTRNEHSIAPGACLPPCLVMERGMSLKEWMAHSRISSNSLANDCKTAIKVRSEHRMNLCKRIITDCESMNLSLLILKQCV